MAAAPGLTGRLGGRSIDARWQRLDGPQRLAGVDLARGLAVIGMLAAHLLWIEPFDWAEPATWTDVANGRSSILFATLAGVSLGLVTGGRQPLVGAALRTARGRIAVRAALIWLLGLVLIVTGVPVFVILPAYGILFLLALPFLRLGARALLLIAAAIAVVMPFVQVLLDGLPLWSTEGGDLLSLVIGWHYPFTTWIAFVLCGLGVARLGVGRTRVQYAMLGCGGALAAVAYGLDALQRASLSGQGYGDAVWTAQAHSTGILEVVGSGGFALAVLGLCLLVCRRSVPLIVVRWIAVPLRAVGSMPLTAYTAQLVVWAVVAGSALGDIGELAGFRGLEPFWPLTAGVVVGCTAWALLVGRGPLEWLLDRASALVGAPARV